MAYEIEDEGVGIVLVDDSPEIKKVVWDRLIAYFRKHGAYCGESVMQCDGPNIEASEVMSEIADIVFKTGDKDAD